MFGAFGNMMLVGTKDTLILRSSDTFTTFKSQLEAYVDFLHTDVRPFPLDETVELMKIIIAGIKSREEGGKEIFLKTLHQAFSYSTGKLV